MLFAAAAISFGATSCSDFLDEDNKTGETADLAYNTVSGIDGLIQSAYTYTNGLRPLLLWLRQQAEVDAEIRYLCRGSW